MGGSVEIRKNTKATMVTFERPEENRHPNPRARTTGRKATKKTMRFA